MNISDILKRVVSYIFEKIRKYIIIILILFLEIRIKYIGSILLQNYRINHSLLFQAFDEGFSTLFLIAIAIAIALLAAKDFYSY